MPYPAVVPALIPDLVPTSGDATCNPSPPRVVILQGGAAAADYTADLSAARRPGPAEADFASTYIDPDRTDYPPWRTVDVSMDRVRHLRRQQNSRKWWPQLRSQPAEDECVPMYDWQDAPARRTCNSLHELDLRDQLGAESSVRSLGQGTWRVTFRVRDSDDEHDDDDDGDDFDGDGDGDGAASSSSPFLALKTIRLGGCDHREDEFDVQNFDFHRKDAVIYERLTASPNVLTMFGHCGLSGVFELADGGSLDGHLWYRDPTLPGVGELAADWTFTERLRIAVRVALGLRDLHSIGGDDGGGGGRYPPYSQSDLWVDQVLSVDGRWKLSDFNRGYMIRWNLRLDEPCGYIQKFTPGSTMEHSSARSPEEFGSGGFILTERVDVYHLGMVIYTLLTNVRPYEDYAQAEEYRGFSTIERLILDGVPPTMFGGLRESADPAVVAMRTAVDLCSRYQPDERASAVEIADYLVARLEEIEGRADAGMK